jgi:hypothetical protein
VASLVDALRAFAFALPEAWEDHPWGESVAKVGKKVFVFFGSTDGDEPFGFSVKLPISNDEALSMPFTVPTGYGLAAAAGSPSVRPMTCRSTCCWGGSKRATGPLPPSRWWHSSTRNPGRAEQGRELSRW